MTGPSADAPPVLDRSLTVNGLRFHYRDRGAAAAPPLVLLHGFLCHARMYGSLAARMSDRFRVLALDQRGHGETEWADAYGPDLLLADLEAVVEALGLQRLALLGYSFGGAVACTYAARHPERVQRLVLVEAAGGAAATSPRPRWETLLRAWSDVPRPVATPAEAERVLRAIVPRAEGDALGRFVRAGLTQQADGRWTWRWDPQLLAARLGPAADVLWRTLPRVRCPALYVRSADSEMMPLEVAERLVAALPQGEVASIPAAGHFPWFDNPIGIETVLRAFLLRAPE
jgi:pimeloyl-ACP methyl ester carboxylesterase